ncbi:MAG: hypothetical protein H0V86_12985 [Chloroflexia bacterium]|nr:hypothetical protein [Chloroflexia bacterium]
MTDRTIPSPDASIPKYERPLIARLAWPLWYLWVMVAVLDFVLSILNRSALGPIHPVSTFEPLVSITLPAIGALITSRRPTQRLGWVLLGVGLTGVSGLSEEYAIYALRSNPGSLPGGAWVAWFPHWGWALGVICLNMLLPLLYPAGHLPSRRWRPILWLIGAMFLVPFTLSFSPDIMAQLPPEGYPAVQNPLGIEGADRVFELIERGFILYLPLTLACLAAPFVRFRRARGDERLQLKWYACFNVVLGAYLAVASAWAPLPYLVSDVLNAVMVCLGAAALGIAILKYRLYEIDVIIRRTLIYGALTASLVGVYLGGVALLQGLLRAMTERESSLAVVASTLAVAALFQPLRWRIQREIDHRFYRRRYDAAKTLAAYGVSLRDETDLGALTGRLVDIVQESVQPTHVSLWLREPEWK